MKIFSFLIFNMDSRNRYVTHKLQMFNTHSTHFGILIKGSWGQTVKIYWNKLLSYLFLQQQFYLWLGVLGTGLRKGNSICDFS